MAKNARDVFDAMARNTLLPAPDLDEVKSQWFKSDRKDADDAERFKRWLLANGYVTEFVAQVLMNGKAEQLVFREYRVLDRLTSGPMTGILLAMAPNGKKVAIEVLAPDTDEATALGVFQVVMKAAQVKHPNVGAILGINDTEGRRYIVKEHYVGPTLASVLQRRGKLPHVAAAKLFTLAFAGLQALHEKGVPGGDLNADCLLLAESAQGAKGKRIVKILHAGVKRKLFDNAAGQDPAPDVPTDDDIKFQTTLGPTPPEKVRPERDLLRLGCAFYHSITGEAPYGEDEFVHLTRKAMPLRQLAPQVPSMLADIIDELLEPDVTKRPKKAAHVGKALRVYLAAEEDDRVPPEENLATDSAVEEVYVLDGDAKKQRGQEPAAKPVAELERPRPSQKSWFPPRPRDYAFFGMGTFLILVMLLILHLAVGWTIVNSACLLVGCAASFMLDRLIVWVKPRMR